VDKTIYCDYYIGYEVHTEWEKPNGEHYIKITYYRPLDYNNTSYEGYDACRGYINQYNHKLIATYEQYKLILDVE
jgi:hypothetical protein